jgi:hypothetical protein
MNAANPFGRLWARLLTRHPAANDDHGPEVSAVRADVEGGARPTGWDAYEVWRRMVREPRQSTRSARRP